MKKITGQLISDIILKENVSQTALCRGLCSTSAFSRYLTGEREMDRLLFTVVLQRLGKSPDKFVTMLTEGEYRYFEWKQRICVAWQQRDWEKVVDLLQESEAADRQCNPVLQEQYYQLIYGIVQEKVMGNRQDGIRCISQAIALTVPGFPEQMQEVLLCGKQLLGAQEILAMLLWQSMIEDTETSHRLLPFLLSYMDAHYGDEQEIVKLYPKVAAQYLDLLICEEKYHEVMSLSEKVLGMMSSTGYAVCVVPVLTMRLKAAEELGLAAQMKKQEKQLEAWREIMQEYGMAPDNIEDLFMLDIWQEVELIHETLGLGRRENELSQEKLSEGICTPETFSRIETGKRPPRRSTYHALNTKLSLRRDYFYSIIATDDFAVLEEKWKLDMLLMLRQWNEAESVLGILKDKLDMTQGCNRQYAVICESIIRQELNRANPEEEVKRLIDALKYTVDHLPDHYNVEEWPETFWLHPFTNGEINALINIADALVLNGQIRQAVYLLERVYGFYEDSFVNPEFHYRNLVLVEGRLCVYCAKLGEYREVLSFCEKGICLTLSCKSMKMIPMFVNNKADALENLGEKEPALKFYRIAFYLSEFMQTVTAAVAKRSYEKLIGYEVEWY